MRYILQVLVMLGDVLLIVASAYMLYFVLWVEFHPLPLVVMLIAWQSWFKTGGFSAWRLFTVRIYMQNAKRLGL